MAKKKLPRERNVETAGAPLTVEDMQAAVQRIPELWQTGTLGDLLNNENQTPVTWMELDAP